MTTVKERIEGHYEVERIPYGTVYKWTPGYVLVECDCGQLMIADATTTVICPECDGDYIVKVEGLEGRALTEDEVYRPEHRAYEEWQREERAHPEYNEWMEWQELE